MHTISQLAATDPKATVGRIRPQDDVGAVYDATHGDMDIRTTQARDPIDDDSQPIQGAKSPLIVSNEEVQAAVLLSMERSQSGDLADVNVEINLKFPTDLAVFRQNAAQVELLEAKISELASLPEDYDGEGAAPVSVDAIRAAKLLVNDLYWVHGLVCDHVAPLADGGVELEFENTWVYFDIWVHDADRVQFVANRGGRSKHGSGAVFEIPDSLWKAIA